MKPRFSENWQQLTRWPAATRMAVAGVAFSLIVGSVPCPAQAAEDSSGETKTYYLLVFSGPLPNADAEFNRWYLKEHLAAVSDTPGVVSSKLYRFADTQLPGTPLPLHPYVACYKIVSSHLPGIFEEIARRSKTITLSESVDRSTISNYIGVALSPQLDGRGPHGTEASSVVYLQLTFSEPAPAVEDDFNSWYDKSFVPGVLGVRGSVAALRQARNSFQSPHKPGDPTATRRMWSAMAATTDRPKYLTMFSIETADIAATLKELQQTISASRSDLPSGATMPVVYTYKAAGPDALSPICVSRQEQCDTLAGN